MSLDKRLLKIISHCEKLRENNKFDYEEKYKLLIDKYSKEIVSEDLISKCNDTYFAKQLCMANGLKYN